MAQIDEGVADGGTVLERDLGRLRIRTLADAGPHAAGREALHVGRRPMQVRLDHRADVVAVATEALDHLQRPIGVGR